MGAKKKTPTYTKQLLECKEINQERTGQNHPILMTLLNITSRDEEVKNPIRAIIVLIESKKR